MYLLVLGQEFQLFPESWHLGGKDLYELISQGSASRARSVQAAYRKDMLFFYGVMNCQVMAELLGSRNKLPQRHILRPFAAGTSSVQDFPSCSKVVMKIIHVLRHIVVNPEICCRHLGQHRCCNGRLCSFSHIDVQRAAPKSDKGFQREV